MGRGQNLLNLVKKIKQEKQIEEIKTEIAEVVKPENLKAGVTAFGVEGNPNIVDTSDGNTGSGALFEGLVAYSKGKRIVGSVRKFNYNNPIYPYGTNTVVSPENPYLLYRMYGSGTIKGEVIRLKAPLIDYTLIQGKNICVVLNYDKDEKYHIIIGVCDWGNKFTFSNDFWRLYINCKNSRGTYIPFKLYYKKNLKSLDDIYTTEWSEKTINSTYWYTCFSNEGDYYGYSRDDSIGSGGVNGSTGINGVNNKIILKNTVGPNTVQGYFETKTDMYNFIPYSIIANSIKLKSEDIMIGKTYLGITGSADIDRTIAYDDLLNLSSEILGKEYENPYERLEYIEGNGRQYINTKVNPNAETTKAEIDYQMTSTKTGEQWIFGQWYNGGWRCGGTTGKLDMTAGFTYSSTVFTDRITATSSGSPITSTYPMLLFAQQEQGYAEYVWNGCAKLYRCKMWEGEELIRDFIPAKHKRTGSIGLYDLVNREFYMSLGTENFIAGPTVEWEV